MMQKLKSEVRLTYPSSAGNLVVEILLPLFMVAGLFFNTQLAPRNTCVVFWVIFGLLWGINLLRFYRNTGVGIVKCCSLQLIICGLLGALCFGTENRESYIFPPLPQCFYHNCPIHNQN